MQRPKFVQKGVDFHLRCVMEDDRKALGLVKEDQAVPVPKFEAYHKERRRCAKTVDKMEFKVAMDAVTKTQHPITMAMEEENSRCI